MSNVYHKGKYRSGEWCKHLRPLLKRIGNKRWRKDGRVEASLASDDIDAVSSVKRKKGKLVKVKFKMESAGGFKFSYYAHYASVKSAKDAIKRNEVVGATVFERNGKIIGNYGHSNTKSTSGD